MKHKIFSNDDAWMLAFVNPPLTPDKMWEDMIKPHIGSPIKGFMWSVGGHDIWDFETNIGERADQAYGNSKDKSQKTKQCHFPSNLMDLSSSCDLIWHIWH